MEIVQLFVHRLAPGSHHDCSQNSAIVKCCPCSGSVLFHVVVGSGGAVVFNANAASAAVRSTLASFCAPGKELTVWHLHSKFGV